MAYVTPIDVDKFRNEMQKTKFKHKMVLLLGAGCSTPVIPVARDIVNELLVEDGKPPLKESDPVDYSYHVTRLIEADADRQTYFRDKCKDKGPTEAHRNLAQLVEALLADGQPPLILTTNFDPLLEKALNVAGVETMVHDLVGGQKSVDDLWSELQDNERTNTVAVVKLLGGTTKGTVRLELERGVDIAHALTMLLPDTSRVVVVGYSGADRGVADLFGHLFKDRGNIDPKNLYWCTEAGKGSPYADPRNHVAFAFRERHSKWVDSVDFASVIAAIGGEKEKKTTEREDLIAIFLSDAAALHNAADSARTNQAQCLFIDSLVKRVERKIEDSAPEFQRHVVRQAAFRELQTTIQSATALCSTFTQPGAYRRLLRHKLDADKFSAVYERFSDTLFALGITEVEDASGWRAAQDLDHRHTEEVLKVIESDEADHTANAALATMQTAHHPKKRPRLIADGEEIGELRKDMMRRNKAQTDARAKGDDEGQGKDAWEIYYKEIVFSKDDDDDKIELGDGAFGKVYKGQFQGQGVAIKSVKILTPKLRSMARKEIAVMARLGHPHVVTFFGATVQKTKAHLVLQLCRCSLHRLIYHTDHEDFAGIHFDDVMRMRFAKETASGLEYLHDSRVVHRDIKPENLLYEHEGDDAQLKIIDFGFAREFTGSQLCKTPALSLGYGAPEVLEVAARFSPSPDKGKKTLSLLSTGGYDKSCDLWSLGVILYAMLAGYPPFHSRKNMTAEAMLERVKGGDFKFPEAEWAGVSAEAKDLVRGLLTVDSSKRLTAEDAAKHPWLAKLRMEKEELGLYDSDLMSPAILTAQSEPPPAAPNLKRKRSLPCIVTETINVVARQVRQGHKAVPGVTDNIGASSLMQRRAKRSRSSASSSSTDPGRLSVDSLPSLASPPEGPRLLESAPPKAAPPSVAALPPFPTVTELKSPPLDDPAEA
mmetsp:Transcript_22471/g.58664  ORF Transcript_22471/g.58664 Transcript_22471/m.58664 type:complete len:938 (+) Transcript_22471:583-3396(+)